jgi:cyclic lactone autoinducer peptide
MMKGMFKLPLLALSTVLMLIAGASIGINCLGLFYQPDLPEK